uniref:Uncharacterized protein n=1 Tax=Chromera velia CCMP2878 TaxID=1169474 RepID=A0A0G4HBM2_9ALVE|eukprot:Cvel_25856.t1-p1 / transcript=Cvel_25856.t1 / gene=Cvel_25856 / organism=Chromera_velia_CCMP2878 / gene_product=hypothetical protein / transcript_product=hypothetical protein / location=Cvel_scaffold2981:14829-16388(+) / protein_length=440 / sequence_SO=supercontig / SO=protein_coding / is_pseudo=false
MGLKLLSLRLVDHSQTAESSMERPVFSEGTKKSSTDDDALPPDSSQDSSPTPMKGRLGVSLPPNLTGTVSEMDGDEGKGKEGEKRGEEKESAVVHQSPQETNMRLFLFTAPSGLLEDGPQLILKAVFFALHGPLSPAITLSLTFNALSLLLDFGKLLLFGLGRLPRCCKPRKKMVEKKEVVEPYHDSALSLRSLSLVLHSLAESTAAEGGTDVGAPVRLRAARDPHLFSELESAALAACQSEEKGASLLLSSLPPDQLSTLDRELCAAERQLLALRRAVSSSTRIRTRSVEGQPSQLDLSSASRCPKRESATPRSSHIPHAANSVAAETEPRPPRLLNPFPADPSDEGAAQRSSAPVVAGREEQSERGHLMSAARSQSIDFGQEPQTDISALVEMKRSGGCDGQFLSANCLHKESVLDSAGDRDSSASCPECPSESFFSD